MTDPTAFAKAYGSVLLKTARSWVFNCDSGCFADVCTKECWTSGPYLCIYQPHKSMAEYDDMYATCFIKRLDKAPITKAEFQGHKTAEAHMLASFEDYVRASNGLWTHPIDATFDKLVQIKDPIRLEKGQARFTFEIRGSVDGCCGDCWEPHLLEAFVSGEPPEVVIDNGAIVDVDFGAKLTKPVTRPATEIATGPKKAPKRSRKERDEAPLGGAADGAEGIEPA